MSDHYNLRLRPTVTANEGMDVEQAPEGPVPWQLSYLALPPPRLRKGRPLKLT